MQQRAAVPTLSPFEPILTSFAALLRAFCSPAQVNLFHEELTQQASHRFQQALETSGETVPAAATRYRLGVQAALDTLREAKKQKEEPAIVWVEMNAAAQAEAEQQQQFLTLQKTLTHLPEQQRRLLALRLLGLSPAEIGHLFGWAATRVQKHSKRGWQQLRVKLTEAKWQVTEEAELQAIYQSQPTRAELNRADCLADEFLARACANDISEADRLFIADHLASCQDCAQEFQLVRALQLWSEEAAAVPTNPVLSEEAFPIRLVAEPVTAAEVVPRWWQALVPQLVHYTGFNLFTGALTALFLMLSLSLATWLVALHFKHKAELARLQQQQQIALVANAGNEPATPEMLQARVEEAQKQLTEIQTQITEQSADKVLSNQELLGIQNDTLQKELDDLSKPQLDAPVVDIDLAVLRATAEAGKEIVTSIDVPFTSAVFTVILHKPADKNAANYLLELFEAKKPKALWSAPKKLENQAKITLTLAKRNYPAGRYRFTLSGVEGKKKELLESYHFDVKYQSSPKPKKVKPGR